MFTQGKLQSGTVQLDYQSGGIGIAPLADFVPDPVSSEFDSIRKDLESAKITIQPFAGQ
jgi:hypothetical protein